MKPNNRRIQSVVPRPILQEPSSSTPGPRTYPIQLDSTATAMAALVLLIALFFLCFFSACARRLFSLVHRRDAHLYSPSILPHPRRYMAPYPPPYGLDPATLQSLPVVMGRKEFGCCVVCLSDFEEKDHIKVIPRCGHGFHPGCIDVWLLMQGTCPVCRCSDMVSAASRCYPGLDSVPVNGTSIDNSGCSSGINLEQVIEVVEEHHGRDGKELLVRLEKCNSWGHRLGTARNAHESSIRRTVSF